MKKKVLLSAVVFVLILTVAAGLTAAQQFKTTVVRSNYVTIGKVDFTLCEPSPLIQQGAMALGQVYTITGTLTPKGDINQDLYAGLKDEEWQSPGQLGDVVQYLLYVEGAGWIVNEWTGVDDLFKNWRKLRVNVAPGTPIPIVIKLRLNPDITDYTPFMGITHWFKVLLFAVNTGGTPPSTPPWQY